MKPRIIFFDIDGTLVPLKEGIRPRTVEALQKLRQNGIRLCIATGRTPMEMPKFEGVTFDALLTYNGSYCFTPERDIFKNLIPKVSEGNPDDRIPGALQALSGYALH